MSFQTGSNEHLIRSNLWSTRIKEVLEAELYAMRYVDLIQDFPDGDTVNIPSIGQAEVQDFEEGQAVRYTGLDTGNFTFSIDQYKASAHYITEKFKQDSFYAQRVVSEFVPKESRAIMSAMESDVLAIGPDGQTSSDPNTINGAHHRFVASGTDEVISIEDFAYAKYALQKAMVPMTNLVAIVDPSLEFELSTLSNLVNVSNNPRWEGIVRDGMSTGMKFLMNVYGFDVYVSHFLKTGVNESITGPTGGSVTSGAGVANLFFSATPDVLPFVGNLRQPPKVDSEFNKDEQREEYVTTARWGFKLFRPENLVTVITDTDQVSTA